MRAFIPSILSVILIAVIASVPARSDPLSEIPADIADIRLFGSWEDDAVSGIYRGIVSVPEPGRSRFTLQWVAFKADGSLGTVSHSMPVPEVSEIEGIITGYRGEVDEQGLTVFLDIQERPEALEDTYVLYVNGPDDYLFEGASN
ncbi:MAG: hypothetical protein AAGF59_02975 [Pseudomonadota bacterium]